MNYFELLDLEQKYDLNQKLLHKHYLKKQSLYHPDKVGDNVARNSNLNISMQINAAYKTLKDDYMRAEYLLQILGQPFNNENLRNILSHAELEEIMHCREQCENTEKLSELQILKNTKLLEQKAMMDQLTHYFQENNITKALDITLRLKYLTNLVKYIKSKIQHADH